MAICIGRDKPKGTESKSVVDRGWEKVIDYSKEA